MFSKSMGVLALFVVATLLHQTQAQNNTTVTTTTSRPPTRPSTICAAPRNCTQTSLSVCARSCSGICRRFRNICELERSNCPAGIPLGLWSRVATVQCQELAIGAERNCAGVRPQCPRRPLRCPRVDTRICAQDLDGNLCRLVASGCNLTNLNCFTSPRGNWSRTEAGRCEGMRVGGEPARCRAASPN